MVPAGERSLDVELLGNRYQLPFGFAPMGMCNLVCPHADQYMAETASQRGLPHCLSSAGSTSLEQVHGWADGNAWFQLYFRQSEQATMAVVDRVRDAGYKTLVLTVDVPQVSRRLRDLRNGFNVPFSLTVRSFIDFASHPRWSLATLLAGIPSPQNFSSAVDTGRFDRKADRAGADWDFLARLRKRWHGKLIVKGITSASDAKRIVESGADAIYVSNHGARQLDATAAAIDLLMPIRRAVGPSCPLIFDSGIRNGEDVAIAAGRFARRYLGCNGATGCRALIGAGTTTPAHVDAMVF